MAVVTLVVGTEVCVVELGVLRVGVVSIGSGEKYHIPPTTAATTTNARRRGFILLALEGGSGVCPNLKRAADRVKAGYKGGAVKRLHLACEIIGKLG